MFRKPRKIGKRAFKIDPEATANRLPAFQHPRSFVSLDGHEILFGPDKEARRRLRLLGLDSPDLDTLLNAQVQAQ